MVCNVRQTCWEEKEVNDESMGATRLKYNNFSFKKLLGERLKSRC